MLQIGVKLVFELIARGVSARPGGVSALNHEATDNTMKAYAIIEASFRHFANFGLLAF